ncbi:integrin beta-1-like [Gigantopelta aegis]|uniref:integrin beta-1-like n=1 Tax=Gigantopelta aegis TaxID=1735272 RepID=UPI001B88861E|nr:integrin beta-1-like [Gigantopelta aegis]
MYGVFVKMFITQLSKTPSLTGPSTVAMGIAKFSQSYSRHGAIPAQPAGDPLREQRFGNGHDTSKMSNITDQYDLPLSEKNQVSLQAISLKLRVGEPLTFTVSVKAAEDFPLDLYMLMDLSGSFYHDLVVVKGLAPTLPLALRNVLSDFLIGFGTFVDKPSLPYTSSVQKNTKFTFLDPLGAMLQAVVCKDLVGWREKSRKILLVMKKDVLHTAGDGRLAGIVKPNDGQCHTQYDPSYKKIVNTAASCKISKHRTSQESFTRQ